MEGINFYNLKIAAFRGIQKGFNVTYELAKTVVPVYFLITILKYSGILSIISKFFEPVMKLVGLPGEASLIFVIGNVLNLYPTIAAIAALHLTTKQVTIIATMLLLSHNLFVETAVSKKSGVAIGYLVLLRLTAALFSGFLLNIVL
ncbi:nucleoside recognition domain-containing protein [Carboxydothermus pertinax]|uniref:Nucleoside transporter/FeoB GTPase Gate domain-containing protein n=1 Tax=Carboxydothermus pertinax TaxID=870242 RepID=A0A1L8CWP9_9THEO|nr:nucleoside recognition domain-containing protein [Carboxydothermus pertinax]GAV23327.1 hypothetical protein cpu_18370 [Carboxydothermus pertinax]